MRADIRDKYFKFMQEVQEKLKKLYGKEFKFPSL